MKKDATNTYKFQRRRVETKQTHKKRERKKKKQANNK